MPELPEVETVLRGISPFMEGNEIEYAEVNRPDLRKPFPNNLAKRLKNRKINFLHRRSWLNVSFLSGFMWPSPDRWFISFCNRIIDSGS